MLAALNGKTEAVRLLIDNGAFIGARDKVSKRFFILTRYKRSTQVIIIRIKSRTKTIIIKTKTKNKHL